MRMVAFIASVCRYFLVLSTSWRLCSTSEFSNAVLSCPRASMISCEYHSFSCCSCWGLIAIKGQLVLMTFNSPVNFTANSSRELLALNVFKAPNIESKLV